MKKVDNNQIKQTKANEQTSKKRHEKNQKMICSHSKSDYRVVSLALFHIYDNETLKHQYEWLND